MVMTVNGLGEKLVPMVILKDKEGYLTDATRKKAGEQSNVVLAASKNSYITSDILKGYVLTLGLH